MKIVVVVLTIRIPIYRGCCHKKFMKEGFQTMKHFPDFSSKIAHSTSITEEDINANIALAERRLRSLARDAKRNEDNNLKDEISDLAEDILDIIHDWRDDDLEDIKSEVSPNKHTPLDRLINGKYSTFRDAVAGFGLKFNVAPPATNKPKPDPIPDVKKDNSPSTPASTATNDKNATTSNSEVGGIIRVDIGGKLRRALAIKYGKDKILVLLNNGKTRAFKSYDDADDSDEDIIWHQVTKKSQGIGRDGREVFTYVLATKNPVIRLYRG